MSQDLNQELMELLSSFQERLILGDIKLSPSTIPVDSEFLTEVLISLAPTAARPTGNSEQKRKRILLRDSAFHLWRELKSTLKGGEIPSDQKITELINRVEAQLRIDTSEGETGAYEAGRKATHGDKEKSSSSTTVSRSGGESESSQGSEDLISRLGRLITRTTFKAKAGEDVSGQDDYGTSLDRDPAAGNTGADSTFSKAGYQGGQESEEQIDDHQPQRPRNREEQGQEREKKGFFKQRSQKEGTTEETARAEGSGFFDDLSKKEQRKFRQLSPAEAILEAAEKCMEIFQVFTDAELRKTRSKAVFTSGTFPWRAIFTWIFVITLVLAAGFCAVAFWPEQPIAANNVEPRVRDVNSPDTIPPEAPVIISPGNNSRLKRNLQMVYGISEARSWVTLYNGETLLGRSLTDDKMVWSISPTPELGPGRYSLHAVAEDQAGNLSGPSRINKVQVLERSPKVVSPTSHKAKSGPSGD